MKINVKISGSGTKEELNESIVDIIDTILSMTDEELGTKRTIENSILCAEVYNEEN